MKVIKRIEAWFFSLFLEVPDSPGKFKTPKNPKNKDWELLKRAEENFRRKKQLIF